MANEFKVKNGLIVIGDLTTSGTITINGALAATQSWVTSQAYLTSASLSGYATQSYVTSAISALVDAAPAALDTLNELAAALGDDANFSTTITNSIASKQAQLNGTGLVRMSGTSVSYDNSTYLTSYTETDTLATVTGRGATTNTSITVGPDLTIQADGGSGYTASRLWLNSHNNYRGAGIHMSGVGSTWFAGTPYTDFDGGYVIARTGTSNDQASAQYSNALLTVKSSGNIGIGTSNPGSKLSVFGNNDVFSVISQTGDTSIPTKLLAQYVGLFNNGANGHHLYINSSQELGPAEFNLTKTWGGLLTLGVSGDGTFRTRALYVNSNGYVGVNVNPISGDRFEVAGSVRIHTGNNWDAIQIYSDGANGYIQGLGDETGLRIRSEAGNILLADNRGNVGIGTTSPTQKLDVLGNIGVGEFLYNRNNTAQYLQLNTSNARLQAPRLDFSLGATSAPQGGDIQFASANGSDFTISYTRTGNAVFKQIFASQAMEWQNNVGNTVFYANNASNVGIGTTSPSTKLDVVGGIISTGTYQARMIGGAGGAYFGSMSSVPVIFQVNQAEVARFDESGNLGVGTTSPASRLHVYTNSDVWHTRIGGASGELRIGGQTPSGAVIQAYTPGGSVRQLYLQRDGGNVGIGNDNPTATLQINGAGGDSAPTLRLISAASDIFNWASDTRYANLTAGETSIHLIGKANSQYNQAYFGYRHVADGSASNMLTLGLYASDYLLNILGNGNVGVGTTSPSQKFVVSNGSAEVFKVYSSGEVIAGTNYIYAAASGNSFYSEAAANFRGIIRNDVGAYLQINGGTSGYTYFSGNVGVGTTNPTSPLEITNTGSAGGGYSMYTSGYSAGKLWGMRKYGIDNGNGIHWSSDVQFSSTWYNSIRIGHGQNATNPSFQSYYTTYLATTGGNVGIGTTSPFYNLDVNGNVGIIGSNSLYFGHGAGNGSWTTRQYASSSTHYFNAQTFIFNNDGYGSYQHMALTANGVNLRGKNTIDSTDSWLRLNQSGDYGSGVYTPGLMRADGGFYVSGSTVWHAGNLTNLNQLTNGPGYITGYSETDPIYVSERNSLQLNKTVHPTLLFSTLADYNKPSGYSTMIQPGSYQTPLPSHGYYHIIARRDGGGGYGALLQSYNSHDLYHGNTTESTTNISWYKIWNSGDFTSTNVSNWNTAYSWGNHASYSYATTSYVTTQINNLINGAPGALDTLSELATALGNDASFATTVTNSIAGKVSKAGDTMTSSGQQVLNIFHGAATGDFNDALFVKNTVSEQQVQIGMATTGSDGDHHRVSLRAYKGAQALEGVFGIALRQPGSAAHTQRLTLDYLGNLTIGGALTESSSLKLKENVETSEGNLEKVVNLRPVTYNKIGSQTTELGLIAEEVAEVYPEFVQYDENGEPIGVNYSRLTAALIGAVKQLTQRIETLEKNG
jgi:hypothetical protein